MKKSLVAPRRAFSLIELLIVITIIGILAVVFLPKITEGPARARDAQRVSDVSDIANAVELYNQDNEAYPVAANWTAITPTALGIATYFDKGTIPQDPQGTNAIKNLTGTGSYFYKQNVDGFIVVADTETDKFTDGYYKADSVTGAFTPPFTLAVSPTDLGEDNVYAYWK